ncbi:MAG: hypothetical protein ACM3TN_19625 [Alphaproteobacteria bacterium]
MAIRVEQPPEKVKGNRSFSGGFLFDAQKMAAALFSGIQSSFGCMASKSPRQDNRFARITGVFSPEWIQALTRRCYGEPKDEKLPSWMSIRQSWQSAARSFFYFHLT